MPHPLEIHVDDPSQPEVAALLREHLASAAQHSPPESVHALDVAGLQALDITFWTAWIEGRLAGCGALKELDARHGEIKSMRTAAGFLRKGVASQVLQHILAEAKHRGYQRMSLETGSMDAFAPARALYERFGFRVCEPFADYVLDPYSVFMTLDLDATGSHGG